MPVTFEYRPQPKTSHPKVDKTKKINHNRGGLSQRQKGEISTTVRKEVNERSGDCCERCGIHKKSAWTLEQAHVEGRPHIWHKTTKYDLARLCGPSTQSGTCHHWVTMTRAGRDWLLQFRKEIQSRG